MGLLSSFKRAPGATPATVDDPQAIEAARVRARRRLVGAVVLLGIGVIAFPLLFETQPRPIPVDIAIEIPRKDNAPPLALPPVAPTGVAAASRAAPVPAAPASARPETAPVAKPEVVADAKAEAKAEPKIEPKIEPKAESKATVQAATALPPPAKAAASSAEAGAGRFVVQVGAFADAAGARGARTKVESLGLRTYTQAVETANGARTRVRIGPFSSRDEADKAAAKLKAAGMPAAVLTL